MRKLRVLVLLHEDLVPPEHSQVKQVKENTKYIPWKTESDVCVGLRRSGHNVRIVGVSIETQIISQTIDEYRPHIIFNLLEEFAGQAIFDQHVVSFLEMLGVKYTGCNPRGLAISKSKDLAKKIMDFHQIPTPHFLVFSKLGRKVIPRDLRYPMFVKSLTEDASIGITQNSVVWNEQELKERIDFFFHELDLDVIAEEYIEGREFYVGVIGNRRMQTFLPWELTFRRLQNRAPKVATNKVKWDPVYRKKFGIDTGPAKGLSDNLFLYLKKLAQQTFSVLQLNGYARIDMRMDREGKVYVIEANPNPDIGFDEDFAASAAAIGISYERLLDRILSLGLSWRPIGT